MDYATSPDQIEAVFVDMRSGLDAEEHRSRVVFAERRARLDALERDVRAGVKSLSYHSSMTTTKASGWRG